MLRILCESDTIASETTNYSSRGLEGRGGAYLWLGVTLTADWLSQYR
jgi:hypothetical protein